MLDERYWRDLHVWRIAWRIPGRIKISFTLFSTFQLHASVPSGWDCWSKMRGIVNLLAKSLAPMFDAYGICTMFSTLPSFFRNVQELQPPSGKQSMAKAKWNKHTVIINDIQTAIMNNNEHFIDWLRKLEFLQLIKCANKLELFSRKGEKVSQITFPYRLNTCRWLGTFADKLIGIPVDEFLSFMRQKNSINQAKNFQRKSFP